MTNWTPAQRAAIEDRGGGLLVSAAAGSGKTAVLTERAVRLITDPARPVDADRLLIVTFTNAAGRRPPGDRKSTRLNSSHVSISYAVFCLKKKKTHTHQSHDRR